nr:glycosyltransferase family 4 protein [Isoptericola halotolerans]
MEDGELVRPLAEVAHRVDVLPLGRTAAGVGRARLGSLEALRALPAACTTLWRLTRHLARRRPDVVVTTTMKAHALGSIAARLLRMPLVWHVHDRFAPEYLPRGVLAPLRFAARRLPVAVVANSRATARTLPGAAVSVAYPGFAPEQALDDPGRHRDPAEPVVLLLGRVSPTKGQLELVRAAPWLIARHPGLRIRMVGAPLFGAEEYARAVQQEIDRHVLGDHVRLEGAVDDPSALIDAATVLVHASPVPEPFGQVVVEAMVRGLPVVATEAGGVPEILVPDGGAPLGLLVPPGDVEALAVAVAEVLDDPAGARRRAAAAHASAVERFAVAAAADVVTEVWRRAGASGHRAPRA